MVKDAETEKGSGSTKETKEQAAGKLPFILALIISLIGCYLAASLILVHENAASGAPAGCDYNETVNCSDVAISAWATVFGVPTAAWGLLTYAGFALLSIAGIRRRLFPHGPGGLLLLGSLGALAFGLFLIYIMHSMGTWCVNCLGLDAVHLGLLACSLVVTVPRGIGKAILEDWATLFANKPAAIGIIGGPALAGVLVLVGYPQHGDGADGPNGEPRIQLPAGGLPRPEGPINLDGVPNHGPADAIITVIEFSDYQCPFCSAAHQEIRGFIGEHEESFRFYHFHHPLDMACNPAIRRPFHQHACLAAAAGICAQRQGRFWELNDLLFEHGRELQPRLLPRLVEEAGDIDFERLQECMGSDSTRERILHDLEQGLQVPVEGTPAFIINDRVVAGYRPGMYRAILGELLRNEGRWSEPSEEGSGDESDEP